MNLQHPPTQPFHVSGNIARIVFKIVTAPLLQWSPHAVTEKVLNLSKWQVEYADTPAAVLTATKSQDRAHYGVTGFKPSWVLKVVIKDGALFNYNQVPFSDAIEAQGYTAISYPMASAVELSKDAKFERGNAACGRTRVQPGRQAEHLERSKELGRLADIFRYAAKVVVFCAQLKCDHTSLNCPWGNRIWTIPEILHAQNVLRMTRKETDSGIVTTIFPMPGHVFREAVQTKAAFGNQWHLYAIYQNSLNSGSIPWQIAIHSLVVEAIRRDEAGNFHDHKYLGKALNGLLPRRAHLDDLGRGGWNDLAWLLELNQGFYNAASLAAICAIPEDSSVSWLGRPIQPMPGNERLQAIVTALPVSPPAFPVETAMETKIMKASSGCPPLMIIGGEMIGLRSHLRRDWAGLYNNPILRPIRIVAGGTLVVSAVLCLILVGTLNIFPALGIFLSVPVGHVILELLVSTMFLERKGWIFLSDSEWSDVETMQDKLGYLDSNLRKLKPWGKVQLVPKWQDPIKRPCISGKFVDLEHGIYVEATVVERPNVLVPLAIHGNGVTCVLLRRGNRSHEKVFGAQKVGIANFPPHVLAQTTKMGTMSIGSQWEEKSKTEVCCPAASVRQSDH
ncbi:HET domain-containing protein [Mycena venus]|uniref:HET domain-containing protein n=1 Tax=Mycena venus TaxID=2733690 RepID=A0A8H6X7T6_9AGAR|nr:HET domain-containing protein [Mycena venus]